MASETEKQQFTPESQKERWIKYGANVALSVLVVLLLGAAIVYLAQRFTRRVDTTSSGIYSLKPQTVNLIKDLGQKVKLVSLYQEKDAQGKPNPYSGPVRDLLEEYSRKGKNIEYDVIDPVMQPTKTDNLVQEAVSKYGGATKAYKDFLAEFDKTYAQLKELTAAEAAAIADIQTDKLGEDERGQTLAAIVATVREQVPQSLARLKERNDKSMKAKFPDYKAITDRIKDSLDSISQAEGQISKLAMQFKDDAKIPDPLRKYFADSPARLDAIKKLADDTMKKIDGLGELKVGELQQAIKGQDLILVLGENDWKVIDSSQVWITNDRDLRNFTEGQQLKPRFAGEQAVTTAILNVTSGNKQKIAFVRPGGAPLTTPGFPPFTRGGPLSEIADRLRGYNFDVVEKDLSGMYAMQAQMQGQPPAPEPSDEEIKNALWIVVDVPSGSPMGPTPAISTKVAEHLRNGGSAMVMALRGGDNMSDVLKEYGIEMSPDVVIVHDVPKGERARSADMGEEVQRVPYVFVTSKYGDHLFTEPLRSLESLLAFPIPVKTSAAPGVKVTPLLPIPEDGKVWGERNLDSLGTDDMKFDESGPMADMTGPFWTGAVAEKDKSRLVVFGILQSFTNEVVNWPDSEMLKRGIPVRRFPGNGELFTNAVFWLARMEPMIAISPAAMEVSRLAPMSDSVLTTWRVGVLLVLLPGLVLASGIWMYFARRD